MTRSAETAGPAAGGVDRPFLLRQLAWLGSEEPQAVAARLRDALDEHEAALVDEVLGGERGAVQRAALARVLALAGDLDLDPVRTGHGLLRLQDRCDQMVLPALRAFRGMTLYLGLLTLALLGVLALFVLVVLPQFSALHLGLGTSLPPLTAFAISTAGQLLLAGTPALLVVLLLWLDHSARRVFTLRATASAVLAYLPLAGRPFRLFAAWLQLSVMQVLNQCGAPLEGLHGRIDVLGGHPPAARMAAIGRCIGVAERLGTGRAELDHWCDALQHEWMLSLVQVRDLLSVLVQLLVGAVVAVLIISMYLPLFSLGQAL